MKKIIEEQPLKDCRNCMNAVKDKNKEVIGCREKSNCHYEERK